MKIITDRDFDLVIPLVVRVVPAAQFHAPRLQRPIRGAVPVQPAQEFLRQPVPLRSDLFVELLPALLVLLLEHLLLLAQVLDDLLLLLRGEQVAGARAPLELVQLFAFHRAEELALEGVQIETVVNVGLGVRVSEVSDRAPACRIPPPAAATAACSASS